jgi:hypothetical protein
MKLKGVMMTVIKDDEMIPSMKVILLKFFFEYDDIVYNDENNDVNGRDSYVDEIGGFVDTEGATMRMMMSASVVYVS